MIKTNKKKLILSLRELVAVTGGVDAQRFARDARQAARRASGAIRASPCVFNALT